MRTDLQTGTDTTAPFGTQITDDGSTVVRAENGLVVRVEIATANQVSRSLPPGFSASTLSSIDATGQRVGVTSAGEAAFVVDMTTGQSTRMDTTVPGAQPGDVSRNPVLSADGTVVAFVTQSDGRLYVHVRDAGTTAEVPLVLAAGRIAPATISDDGQRIALAVDRTIGGQQVAVRRCTTAPAERRP